VTITKPVVSAPPPSTTVDVAEDDSGTLATVAEMQRMIEAAKLSATIQQTAMRLTAHVRSFDVPGQIRAVCHWTKRNIRFRNDPTGAETLRTPELTLQWRAGDCDDFAMLISALLESIGIETRLTAVATHPGHPEAFTHVYPEAKVKGHWLACDMARPGAAIGKRPRRVYRAQTFQLAGPRLAGFAGYFGQTSDDVGGALLVGATGTSIADILAASHPQSTYTQTGETINVSTGGPGSATTAGQLLPGITGASITGNTWLLIGGALLLVLMMSRK
jgi:hypothetical protein